MTGEYWKIFKYVWIDNSRYLWQVLSLAKLKFHKGRGVTFKKAEKKVEKEVVSSESMFNKIENANAEKVTVN